MLGKYRNILNTYGPVKRMEDGAWLTHEQDAADPPVCRCSQGKLKIKIQLKP